VSGSHWTVPRSWAGETVAILGSGPSMSREVAETVKGRCKVIAVNDQAIDKALDGKTVPALAPWADVLFAADAPWWRLHEAQVAKFKGLKVSRGLRAPIKGIHYLLSGGQNGVAQKPTHLCGINSGQMAANLAYHFGAKRILLCGFDCKGGRWWGNHPKPLSNQHHYSMWLKAAATAAAAYKKHGVDIVNCTPGSALKCFRMSTLEVELGLIKEALAV
jgi:hypothetical protein